MPRGTKQAKKILSATDVFEKIEELLVKKYPKLEKFDMPYCSLVSETDTKEKKYRVQVEIHFKDKFLSKSAVAEIDAKSGAITMFKEGFQWEIWA